jgi:hypothetical protein
VRIGMIRSLALNVADPSDRLAQIARSDENLYIVASNL